MLLISPFLFVLLNRYLAILCLPFKYILDNIRVSFGMRAGLVSRIATFAEDSGKALTLENFFDYYHLDIRSIYVKDSFSRLSVKIIHNKNTRKNEVINT